MQTVLIGSAGRIRTYNPPVTFIPKFLLGTDYIIPAIHMTMKGGRGEALPFDKLKARMPCSYLSTPFPPSYETATDTSGIVSTPSRPCDRAWLGIIRPALAGLGLPRIHLVFDPDY